jgi:AcrR family transcriptional regulator
VSRGDAELQEHHDRAVQAMAREVAARGYAQTTVEDVLRRAGMSRRTFYRLFANREECFLATYDTLKEDLFERLRAASARGGPHLEGALGALLDHVADRPEVAHVLLTEPAATGASGLERHVEAMTVLQERLSAALALDTEGGRQVTGAAAVGAVAHVIQRHVWQGDAEHLRGLAPDLARLLHRLAE